MENRKKIEIVLAVLLLLILVLVLGIVFLKPGGDSLKDDITDDDVVLSEPIVETTVDSRTLESPPDVIARTFVERFGSYSTDIDYLNVDEVKSLATAPLIAQLDSLLVNARNGSELAYYGVSTKVMTIDLLEENEGSATFTITTQRKETIDSPTNTAVRYQDIQVNMSKAGERWLVNNFTWQE